MFVTNNAVSAINNVFEHARRPSAICRKVTNGFQSEWGADTYAAFRSVVSTANANGQSVLSDLCQALATTSPNMVANRPG